MVVRTFMVEQSENNINCLDEKDFWQLAPVNIIRHYRIKVPAHIGFTFCLGIVAWFNFSHREDHVEERAQQTRECTPYCGHNFWHQISCIRSKSSPLHRFFMPRFQVFGHVFVQQLPSDGWRMSHPPVCHPARGRVARVGHTFR